MTLKPILRCSVFCLAFTLFAQASVYAESNFTVQAGSSRIATTVSGDFPKLSQQQLMDWVHNAATAIIAYYGRYPVPHVDLRIRSFDGAGVRGGQTFAAHGGLIRVAVGSATTEDDLRSDWMLTHEMVHLTFPSMPDQNHWIEEGIATYVEPIARIQGGGFGVARMWFELIRDLPKGLPRPGDQGLDHTHTWGRTYWGGALFCFLADVEIRKQSHNRKGLQDALRGILNAGGDLRQDWRLADTLKAGDRAVGLDVLSNLYRRMGDVPMDVDLPALWKQLGVRPGDGVALFDDRAPLSDIRQAITHTDPQDLIDCSKAPSTMASTRAAAGVQIGRVQRRDRRAAQQSQCSVDVDSQDL